MNWASLEGINIIELLLEEEIKMIHRFINTLNSSNNIQTIKEKLTANG